MASNASVKKPAPVNNPAPRPRKSKTKVNSNGNVDHLSRVGTCRMFNDIISGRSSATLKIGHYLGALVSRGWSEKNFTKKMREKFTAWMEVEGEGRVLDVQGWRAAAQMIGFEVEGIDETVPAEDCTFWEDLVNNIPDKFKKPKRKRAEKNEEGDYREEEGEGSRPVKKRYTDASTQTPGKF
jgi:hypothetical protein